MKKNIIFVGCGKLSQRVAQKLPATQWQCFGVRRTIDELPTGIKPVQADITQTALPACWPTEALDYVVIAVAPGERNQAAYERVYVEGQRNLYQWLAHSQQQPKRVFFVSSTAVYGQSAGEWVDEQSITAPERWSGKVLLQAEQLALSSGLPATVVRLAGIYGGQRQAFLRRVRQGYHADGCSNRFTNRIHEQDAAQLLSHLLEQDRLGNRLQDVYLGVDDLPVEQAEVVGWLQEQLGVHSVAQNQLKQAGSSKRCSNARAKAAGWQPRYADYRQGYAELL